MGKSKTKSLGLIDGQTQMNQQPMLPFIALACNKYPQLAKGPGQDVGAHQTEAGLSESAFSLNGRYASIPFI